MPGEEKNHIHRIKRAHGWVTEHGQKEKIIHDHFSEVMGRIGTNSNVDFNWDELDIQHHNLHALGVVITEEEVWAAIKEMPNDKAPGPDGFTAGFLRSCWPVVKQDFVRVFQKLYALRGRGFSCLNQALLTLIPKRSDAAGLGDYRPISLIHLVAKIFAKTYPSALRPS